MQQGMANKRANGVAGSFDLWDDIWIASNNLTTVAASIAEPNTKEVRVNRQLSLG
jgi:hypothetical protein